MVRRTPCSPLRHPQRFSINDHITKNIASAMEDAARDVGMADETSGIEKLQNIMTEAKEKVDCITRKIAIIKIVATYLLIEMYKK